MPVLLFFGFLKPYKGLDVFLDALSLLGSRGVEVLGYVAGAPVTAQQERNLRARAAQADLVDMVVLRLGFVDKSEMPAIFGACDLTVAPYKIASQSGVIQMSYAYGRPVVVTDVGGLGDDVDEGETGTIAEASGPEALADTIERLLSDSSQLAAMTEKLEQGPPERFAWDHVAAAHLAYITSRLER
ncbi:MAG: glycosyltransferase [Actinobacteria bacterium ATB1]|nr:glycosyltransferase [Actinobacteria bacterium ATB1]